MKIDQIHRTMNYGYPSLYSKFITERDLLQMRVIVGTLVGVEVGDRVS